MRANLTLLLLVPVALASPRKALHSLLQTDQDPTVLDVEIPDETPNKFTVTFNGKKTKAKQSIDPESGSQVISLSNLALEAEPSEDGDDTSGYKTDSGSEVKSENKRYRYSVGNGKNNLDGFQVSDSGEPGGDLSELHGALEGIKKGKQRGVGWAFADGDLGDTIDGGYGGYGVPRNRGVVGRKRGNMNKAGWETSAEGKNRNRNLEVVDGVMQKGEGLEKW
jgi:hypothetical protein